MPKKHIFLSYCHADVKHIAHLRKDLIAAGEHVWWDRDILPGKDWKHEIRQALNDSYAILLCFSSHVVKQYKSGIFPEALEAINIYREYAPGSIFLIPVRLTDCRIPAIEIDATRTLDRIEYVDLHPSAKRHDGLTRLIQSLKAAPDRP